MYRLHPKSSIDPTSTGASFHAYDRFRAASAVAVIPLWILVMLAADAHLALATWDELQRLVFLQACGIALASTVLFLGLNDLAAVDRLPHAAPKVTFCVPFLALFASVWILRRRAQ